MGVGYKVKEDGSITENYWEPVEEDEDEEDAASSRERKPYRIELVGVVSDAYLAVVRGIRLMSLPLNSDKRVTFFYFKCASLLGDLFR